ncbi:hypothetical protein AX17_006824 [Amanita inopinata Kibby_2008]|nr:hypothetical protein AX17_006824 [Amanita inopinata Kibby_2008]
MPFQNLKVTDALLGVHREFRFRLEEYMLLFEPIKSLQVGKRELHNSHHINYLASFHEVNNTPGEVDAALNFNVTGRIQLQLFNSTLRQSLRALTARP